MKCDVCLQLIVSGYIADPIDVAGRIGCDAVVCCVGEDGELWCARAIEEAYFRISMFGRCGCSLEIGAMKSAVSFTLWREAYEIGSRGEVRTHLVQMCEV